MSRSTTTLLALTVVVVIAGCGGFLGADGGASESAPVETTAEPSTAVTATERSSDGTPADPPTEVEPLAESYDIDVDDGVGANASLVFARVALLVDAPQTPPPDRVIVRPRSEMPTFTTSFSKESRALGIRVAPGRDTTAVAAAFVPDRDRVLFSRTTLGDRNTTARVLAHEFVHTHQYATGAFERVEDGVRGDGDPLVDLTTDRRQVYLAVVEGSASWIESRYWERYVADGRDPAVRDRRAFRNATIGRRVALARYVYGHQYVDEQLDDPGNVEQLYADPPRTTEQLLHGLEPGSEPPANLSVRDREPERWLPRGSDRKGELFTRLALSTELNRSAAAAAADGWGADTFQRYSTPNGDVAVWVHRWDSEREADEFQRHARQYVDRRRTRWNRTDRTWTNETTVPGDESSGTAGQSAWEEPLRYRLERVDERSTVLVFGSATPVRSVTVRGAGGNVTVRGTDTDATVESHSAPLGTVIGQ